MITYQRFMINAQLKRSVFQTRLGCDHEHCTMCGAKFSSKDADLHEGYVTSNDTHWVCRECMNDYRNEYNWTIEN